MRVDIDKHILSRLQKEADTKGTNLEYIVGDILINHIYGAKDHGKEKSKTN